MNIPEIVRIGSVDYKVLQSPDVIMLNHEECKGMIEYEQHVIKLNNDVQDLQGMEQTFLHEIVHGIVDDRKIKLPDADMERIVDDIAVGLHQIIRDNPNVFR